MLTPPGPPGAGGVEAAAALTAADDAATAGDEATTDDVPAGWTAWKAVPGLAAVGAAKEDATAGAATGPAGAAGAAEAAPAEGPPAEGAWAAGGVSAPRALSTAFSQSPPNGSANGSSGSFDAGATEEVGAAGPADPPEPPPAAGVGWAPNDGGVGFGGASARPGWREPSVAVACGEGVGVRPADQPSTSTVAGVSICPPSSASPVPSMGACSKPKTSLGVSRLSRNSRARPTLAGLPDLSQAAHGLRRPNRPAHRVHDAQVRQPGVPGRAAQGGQDAGDGRGGGLRLHGGRLPCRGRRGLRAARPEAGCGGCDEVQRVRFSALDIASTYLITRPTPNGAEKNQEFFKFFRNSRPVTARFFD